jgi:quercetin dioxygenase-like cupin family protein
VIVPDAVRLDLHVEVAALATQASALRRSMWVPHFNREVYEGDWSGIALRSAGGAASQIYPDPAPGIPCADTEVLVDLPAYRTVLDQFECPMTSVRLLALAAGGSIKEHRDYRLGWQDGEVRLHIPIVTSPEVEFVLGDRRIEMAPGEVWYLNVSLPHRVHNRSQEARIHLVVDCVVDPWLTGLMNKALMNKAVPAPK